jgi:sn-glycerol 3-phosphate transport system substrate-binding protein
MPIPRAKSSRWLPFSAFVFVLILSVGCGPASEAPDDGTASITYWRTLTGGAGDAQDEIASQFNDSQDAIEVSVEFQGGYGDLAAKLMTAAAGGTGPDVTQLGTFEIREFVRAGLLADLTPFVEGEEGLDTSDWPGTMLDAGRIGGKLYWLPFNVSAPVLYYNPELFEEAGIQSPPDTWDELFAFARRLTQRDGGGNVTVHGLALWDSTWPLLSAIWSEGGALTTSDYADITLDDPVVVRLFEVLQGLVDDGAAVVPAKALGGHRELFLQGRAAMILDSTAPFDTIAGKTTGFEAQVANYPAGAEGRVYAPGGGGIAMLSRTPGEKRDAAWRFMRFMLQPDQLAYYARRSGYCAFTAASQKVGATWLADRNRAIVHGALPNLRGDFSVNMSPAIRNAFDEAFRRILIRGEDPGTVLREADAEAERDIPRELAGK